jgi:hypothetical protein
MSAPPATARARKLVKTLTASGNRTITRDESLRLASLAVHIGAEILRQEPPLTLMGPLLDPADAAASTAGRLELYQNLEANGWRASNDNGATVENWMLVGCLVADPASFKDEQSFIGRSALHRSMDHFLKAATQWQQFTAGRPYLNARNGVDFETPAGMFFETFDKDATHLTLEFRHHVHPVNKDHWGPLRAAQVPAEYLADSRRESLGVLQEHGVDLITQDPGRADDLALFDVLDCRRALVQLGMQNASRSMSEMQRDRLLQAADVAVDLEFPEAGARMQGLGSLS